jgi:hypothetical protein
LNPMPNFEQCQDRIGPFNSTEELKNQHMWPLNISKCGPLLDRCANWEKKALLDAKRKNDSFYLVRTAVP